MWPSPTGGCWRMRASPMSETDLTPLRPYWYPVALSSEVASEPVGVTILGEQVAVYRSAGGLHALEDLCLHRGSRLSLGSVRDGCLVCPHRGWTYGPSGRCVEIPSLRSGQEVPAGASIHSYHACEQFGMAWVALEEPRLPVPEFPEYDDPDYHVFLGARWDWAASAGRLVENSLDIGHLPWVHGGMLGDSDNPGRIDPYNFTDQPYTGDYPDAGFTFEWDWQEVDRSQYGRPGELLHYKSRLYMPYTRRNTMYAPKGNLTLYQPTLPVSAERVVFWYFMARNHSLDVRDSHFQEFSVKLLAQDKVIVENQRPRALPVDLTEEVHLRGADAVSLHYRRALASIGAHHA